LKHLTLPLSSTFAENHPRNTQAWEAQMACDTTIDTIETQTGGPPRSSLLIQILEGLTRWRQRRLLLTFDETMLKDIAITRCDAEHEAAKKWRA
jgi:uncharacterized protein YjiS (DUF1127 family)